MAKYRSNPHRMRALYVFSLRRLGAAFLTGTSAQVDRWLAAVEQSKRHVSALNASETLLHALY